MTGKDYSALITQGHFMYHEMLGTLRGITDNRGGGLRWQTGDIFNNYYAEPVSTAGEAASILSRMKNGDIPKNLTFFTEADASADPRGPFRATGAYTDGFGTLGMAHALRDTPPPKPEKYINIYHIREISQLKAAGAILNAVFNARMFSFEHFLDMFETDGLCFHLAECDGLPVGACMSQQGGGIVNISWLGTLPGYRKIGIGGHLINAAEREGALRGMATGTLHALPGAVGTYKRLGYKEYCRSVQLVLKEK